MSIKVGDKYIIEIGTIAELPDGKKKYFIKPFESLVFDEIGLAHLEPVEKAWENELEKHRREAYDKGYADGKADATDTDMIGELKQVEYIRGLEDAWKLARKIEMLTCGEIRDIFGEKALTQFGDEEPSVFAIINQFSYKESESMIKAYEEKKKAEEETIKVGDEVICNCPNEQRVIITAKCDGWVTFMRKDGACYSRAEKGMKKTGRHFDEVSQLLDKLRGEEDEKN